MRSLLAVVLLTFLAVLLPSEADAKRLGGARSMGTQRNLTPPPAAPAQNAAAPVQKQAAAAAPTQNRWMPLLGGLALGGLLGWMFSGTGMGVILLIGLLAIGTMLLLKASRARAATATAQPLGYAAFGGETVAAPPPSQSLGSDRPAIALAPASNVPEDFDQTGFIRAAKINFIRLQEANDRRDLDALRELTTASMYQGLVEAIERGESLQTDVVTLDADILELVSESDAHRASVRFRGMMREAPGAEPVSFEEIWNLEKPVDGTSGWLLAGIQQMH